MIQPTCAHKKGRTLAARLFFARKLGCYCQVSMQTLAQVMAGPATLDRTKT